MEATGVFSAQLAAQGRAPRPGPTGDEARARETAQEFESFVISSFAQNMFAGVPTDGPFHGGQGEKMFRSLLIQEYGKEMAQAGGIGLSDQVYKEMLKMQEVPK